MRKKKYLSGDVIADGAPYWEPLREAGADWLLGAFMAMHQIRLENGVTICAYKHCDTRRYVHLAEGRVAYEYIAHGQYQGRYMLVPTWEAFDRAIRDADFLTGFESSSRLNMSRFDEEDEAWVPPSSPERRWPLNRFLRGLSDPWQQPDPPPAPAHQPG